MNKTEIRAELDKRGIVYNATLSGEKLQLILDEVVSATGETGSTGPTEPVASIVKIVDRFGMVCRTYSLEEHGEGYVDLAKQFAAKKGLSIR